MNQHGLSDDYFIGRRLNNGWWEVVAVPHVQCWICPAVGSKVLVDGEAAGYISFHGVAGLGILQMSKMAMVETPEVK